MGDAGKCVTSYRYPLKSLANVIVTRTGYRELAGLTTEADSYLHAVAEKDPSKSEWVQKILNSRRQS